MARAVEVRLELGTLFADDTPLGEAEDLKAAAVGEDRSRPPDEPVQTAAAGDQLVTGPQEQVIGVAEDDLGVHLLQVAMQCRLDGSLRPDRHERRRLHDAVRGLEFTEPRQAVRALAA